MSRKNFNLSKIIALANLAIITGLCWYAEKQENKYLLAELNKPKIIREYIDSDFNGEYDSYRMFKKYRDGREEVIVDDWESVHQFSFSTPFGSKVNEAPRAALNYVFQEWNYPNNVDEIRFENSLY